MRVSQPLPPMPPVAGMALDADRVAMLLVDSRARPDIAATTVKTTVWAHAPHKSLLLADPRPVYARVFASPIKKAAGKMILGPPRGI
jgi:hypothetical protein